MTSFRGFPDGKVKLTPMPLQFFTELLPEIDDLGELKVTAYAFWRLDNMEGDYRYLSCADFEADGRFMQGLAEAPAMAQDALLDALGRAVLRGTLLQVTLDLEEGAEALFFLNSPRGRAAVRAFERGEWRPSGQRQLPLEVIANTPNIFRLYEEHVGPLTPMIAESLREAEDAYPDLWIGDAFRIAVENNKRNWRYISAILNRWQEEGRDGQKDRRDSEKARRRYSDWES